LEQRGRATESQTDNAHTLKHNASDAYVGGGSIKLMFQIKTLNGCDQVGKTKPMPNRNKTEPNRNQNRIRQGTSVPFSSLHNSFKNPQGGTSGGANWCPFFPPGHIGGMIFLRKLYRQSPITHSKTTERLTFS